MGKRQKPDPAESDREEDEAAAADEAAGRQAKEGFALVLAPDGTTSCSFDGVQYDADERGVVEVPAAAVQELFAHGFEAL